MLSSPDSVGEGIVFVRRVRSSGHNLLLHSGGQRSKVKVTAGSDEGVHVHRRWVVEVRLLFAVFTDSSTFVILHRVRKLY